MPCSLGLSATSQQYFSLKTNQPPATSQQYFSLRTNQHQPSTTSQTNRLRGGYGHEAESGALLVRDSMSWESETEENVDSIQDFILMCAPQRRSQKFWFKIFADRFDLGPDQLCCVERIGLQSRPLELEYGESVFEFVASS
jgi:hypothetical protein